MVSYEEGKKVVTKGFFLLGAITILEVMIALVGNGHIIHGFTLPKMVMYPLMVGLSLYKAYWIVYNFMHMAYEVKGMAMSVLLPCCLLVWAVIAFFQEGDSWGSRRENNGNTSHVLPGKPGVTPSTDSQTKQLVPASGH
jgi:cytochrome c oxidase subunit IV